MLRSHTLAAIGVLVVGSALVQAGPPVQVREFLPVGQEIEGHLVLSMWTGIPELNDAGEASAVVRTPEGYAVLLWNGDSWSELRSPVSDIDAAQPGVWRPWGLRLGHNGRVVITAFSDAGADRIWSIREIFRGPQGVTETERQVREPGFQIFRFFINESDTIAWEEIDPSGTTGFVDVWIDRDGETSLVQDADQWFTYYGGGVEFLFDDDSIMLSSWEDDTQDTLIRRPIGDYWAQEFLCRGATDYGNNECNIFANGLGERLNVISGTASWNPSGPSVTPAFVFQPSFEMSRASISRSGRVILSTRFSSTFSVLHIGPDTITDRVLASGDSVPGGTVKWLAARSINSRDEIVLGVGFSEGGSTTLIGRLCPADVNRDRIFDNGDIGEFVTLYLDGSMRTDFNNDGILDNGDITEFITQFLNGC